MSWMSPIQKLAGTCWFLLCRYMTLIIIALQWLDWFKGHVKFFIQLNLKKKVKEGVSQNTNIIVDCNLCFFASMLLHPYIFIGATFSQLYGEYPFGHCLCECIDLWWFLCSSWHVWCIWSFYSNHSSLYIWVMKHIFET